MKNKKNNSNNNIIDKLKDKKTRSKYELIFYGLLILFLLVFARINNSTSKNYEEKDNIFVSNLKDNYALNMSININDNIYEYDVKVLGYNASIIKKDSSGTEYYYKAKDKYYKQDNNIGYTLINKDEIYNVISYNYININNIKEYLKIARKNGNVYTLKVSDIVLNSNNNDNIVIKVDNINNSLEIDYSNLLNVDKCIVNMQYTDINKILTLEE